MMAKVDHSLLYFYVYHSLTENPIGKPTVDLEPYIGYSLNILIKRFYRIFNESRIFNPTNPHRL